MQHSPHSLQDLGAGIQGKVPCLVRVVENRAWHALRPHPRRPRPKKKQMPTQDDVTPTIAGWGVGGEEGASEQKYMQLRKNILYMHASRNEGAGGRTKNNETRKDIYRERHLGGEGGESEEIKRKAREGIHAGRGGEDVCAAREDAISPRGHAAREGDNATPKSPNKQTHTDTKTEKNTDRWTDKQTDGHTDRQTERQMDIQRWRREEGGAPPTAKSPK